MDREVLKNKAGEIFGLNLGADYCAEHEWGIEPMWKAMKVDKNSMDLGRYRAASPQKDNLFYFTSSKVLYIEFSSGERYMNEIDNIDHKKYLKSVLHLHDTKYRNGINFSSAWDEKSFGVAIDSSDSDLLKFGKKLVQAIDAGDFSLWYSGNGNPFSRSGIVVAITSMVPREIQDYMLEVHTNQKKLQDADDFTGIKDLLKKANRKYFACKADWLRTGQTRISHGEIVSKYPVYYFLNPYDQKNNNHGWFTVEELADWAYNVPGNKVNKSSTLI